MTIRGITPTTPDNLLLGAGAFFKNYVVGTDTPASASAKLIGATQGGGSFSAIPTIRKIECDGTTANTKGYQTIDEWVVTMVANVKEATLNSIELALGSATQTSITGYKKIVGKSDIEAADYLTNLTWVGTLKGKTDPVIIVLKNALSLNGFTLTVADKNEAVIPITVTGCYDPADMDSAPFEIYYPEA